jgi:hypothetical protein
MNITLTFTLFIGALFSSQVFAECSTNRNADISITKPDSQYTDHGDGTVTDKQTGLMWQKCTLGLTGTSCVSGGALTLSWQAALASANNNTDYGYSDWRVPNKNELESLVEDACYNLAINETVFPATASSPSYWSSSPYANGNDYAWDVAFYYGYVSFNNKGSSGYVRLVRGSQ